MPAKPTFEMPIKGSDKTLTIKYDRLLYTRGHRAHIFALHREHHAAIARKDKEWIVSDPVSGCRILRVNASYKGMPISSADLTLKQARMLALADLDALVDRVGLDKFERVLDEAHYRAQSRGELNHA